MQSWWLSPSRRRRSGALSPGAAIGSIKRTVALPSQFLAAPQGSHGRSPRFMRPPSRRAASRCLWAHRCLSPGAREPSSLWKSADSLLPASPIRFSSATIRLLGAQVSRCGCESAVPMTAKLALPWESRVVVRWFGQSAPVLTTAPSTIFGPSNSDPFRSHS